MSSEALDALEDPWGQLVSIEQEEEERVPVLGSQFTIGRGKDADLVISKNQFVSTTHCVLVRGGGGEVWIRDTSTNGTLLNGTRLERNKEVKLSNGDIIRVVHRKDRPECNMAYSFHDLRPLPLEATPPIVEDGDTTLELTLDGDTTEGGDTASPKEAQGLEGGKKHLLEEPEGEPPSAKRPAPGGGGKEEPDLKLRTKSEGGTQEGGKEGLTEPAVGKGEEKAPQPPEATPKPALVKKDSIEETLLCQICQEILHDCVSLQPCMHSYCAGCYSDWMGHSNTCPACRNRVERISKNHIVNNLVDAYLRSNPDKKRPEEDLKNLDKKNKITKDMLYPKKRRRYHDDDEDDYTGSDGYDSASPTPLPPVHIISPFGGAFGLGSILTPAPLFLCRQCPGHMDTGAPPPADSTHPTPPPYTCTSSTNHVLCMCCLQPMPDRRHDTDLSIPPQMCDICGQAYCHMYWGCRKLGCSGCLNLFKDTAFAEHCLSNLINDNLYESRVLKGYLQAKGLSLGDVLQTCCTKLDAGEYTCSDSRTHRLSSTTRTCYKCALKNFKDLAYLYRRDIPSDELPAEVTSRSDCYWGKNCRTQKNKPPHAERFNHICEQLRH